MIFDRQAVRDYFTDWSLIKGDLFKKYPELRANDLDYEEGSEESVIEKIEERTGLGRDEILKQIKQLKERL